MGHTLCQRACIHNLAEGLRSPSGLTGTWKGAAQRTTAMKPCSTAQAGKGSPARARIHISVLSVSNADAYLCHLRLIDVGAGSRSAHMCYTLQEH